MKTFYLKVFGKTLLVLLFSAFIQNATAAKREVLLKKLFLSNSNFGIADTPRQVSKAKKVVIDRDRANTKDKDLDKDKKHPEDGVDDDISARQDQETARTKDPAINVVPTERLIQARRIKDRLVAQRANLVKSANKPGGVAPIASISDITWSERGPSNVGGRTRALMFDLGDAANGYKKVFAGGVGGGLWVTNNITASPVSWTKINDFFENIAISCIAQNPVKPQEIYAGTGEGFYNGDAIQGLGVWKSVDGGVTWARLISTSFYTNINAIAVDKNGSVYLAARDFGIMKSGDGGSSWSTAISTTGAADVQLAANGDVYASDGVFSAGHIYISDCAVNGAATGNSGTWTNITPNTAGTITPSSADWWRIKLACAPGDANTVYALFEGTNSYGLASLQRYNKATNTWTVKTVPTGSTFNNGQAWYSIAAAVDPTNANVLYAGSLDGGRSIDGGTTWTVVTQWYVGEVGGLNADQYTHADHHAYVYAPGSAGRFLMGTDGGVFYTSTATAAHPSFADRNNGYNVTQFYSVALHPANTNYALAGAQDNGTQQYTAAGINATTQATGGDGANAFIDQTNGNIQLTSYVYNNFWVSTDNGVNFIQHFFGNTGSFINPSDYDSNSKNLYSGYSGGGYFRWNNITAGTSTSVVGVTAFNGANVTAVTVAPITANRVYFGLDNGKVAIVDNANTGTSIAGAVLSPSGSGTGSVSCVAVDPGSENHILVSYFNYGYPSVYETKNATAATPVWTLVEGNLPDMPVRWAMFYPGDSTRAIIATELGVWTTDKLNSASTVWSPSNSGLANVEVDMLKFRPSDRTLAAATHGRGLFTTILPVVSVISSDASLSQFTVSSGTLTPVFATGTTNYTASVSNAIASVKVTPTTSDAGATVKVNGVTVTSGSASAALPLVVGPNTISTVVTAQDGTTTKTYTLTVTRLSTNALLTSLKINPVTTLTTVTGPGYKNYTTAVPNSETSLTVTSVVQDATATIKVNGTTVASGVASPSMPLVVGANVITTAVTAQDGATVKNYIITATRASSSVATLANLTTSAGTLDPAFAALTTAYTVHIPNATTSIKLTPTATAGDASIKVNGTTVVSGAASASLPLNVGDNIINTVVTASDGTTIKTYALTVTRSAAGLSTNALLTSIKLSPSTTLTTVAGPGYKNYTTAIPNNETALKITSIVQDATATIKVNGVAVTSGMASQSIPLKVGANVINIMVTAQDEATTKNYIITAARASSSTATLSNLALSTGTLSPAFASSATTYTVHVPNATASIKLTPTASNADASIKVNGTAVVSGAASASLPLKVGDNIINTVVTASDGTTIKTYKLTVTRSAAGLSTNALLTSIKLNPSTTLTTVAGPGYKNYTTAVPNNETSLKVTAIVQDATATIKVNGTAVASGAASQSVPLIVGGNVITIMVTAQDGATTKNYIITATRADIPPGFALSAQALNSLKATPDKIVVHQGISPNCDGDNDFLIIDGLAAYPNNSLSIANQGGTLIFKAKGYNNTSVVFDGHSNINGSLQPRGTYFYLLEYNNGNQYKRKSGFLIIKY
ncbi:cadherin-like beta sandwich domain-containing protein [Mucilaginibacter sp.]|uniref:cadherin-like beta sandwich domain-containing protein n=1 Tax=Mucilaginibacter sp. TaxID=1882438 RepID=UPI002631ADDF|nr:cadherin-like beta sandwich domain-containing protein [Mucilaginibacter sp.]MDB4922793.1 Cadherin-like beta sandwich domain protein [Mucilaginibacter sp.]